MCQLFSAPFLHILTFTRTPTFTCSSKQVQAKKIYKTPEAQKQKNKKKNLVTCFIKRSTQINFRMKSVQNSLKSTLLKRHVLNISKTISVIKNCFIVLDYDLFISCKTYMCRIFRNTDMHARNGWELRIESELDTNKTQSQIEQSK